MSKHNEMTRYAFISHMEDYMKKLLNDPLKADTDEFLKGHGIDAPKAMKILTKRVDPNDENSSVVIKKTAIKDNGVDDNGNRLKDTFSVKYSIPRKDYTKKMRNLYISLFESNIVDGCPINEGAWGYGILDNDEALDYQSETTSKYIKNVINDIKNSSSSDNKWARVGVLVDFLKKYKSDELQVSDIYTLGIKVAKDTLRQLFNDESFTSSWDDESKIKSALKKAFNDVSALRYNEDIMISGDDVPAPVNNVPQKGPIPDDGKLMEDVNYYERPLSSTPSPFKSGEKVVSLCKPGSIGDRWAKYVNDNEKEHKPEVVSEEGEGGATTCGASSGQYTAKVFEDEPIRRRTMYITQEQADYIRKRLDEEEGNCPVQSRIGGFGYTAPIGDGKKNAGNDFYKEANDHKGMMAKSWSGNMDEANKNGIHIKEKNKGKFTATKKRTGKSTEELTHSKNPLTRKRANFARMAKRGWKPLD